MAMTEEVRELVELLRDEDNCNVLDYIDDAANIIESLSAQLDQVTRERDAAVEDMRTKAYYCETCVHYTPGYFCPGCRNKSNWQWRGVEVEG